MLKEKKMKITKNLNRKKIIVICLPILIILLIIFITTNSLSKLMGNSVTDYYCEDTSYVLEGNKCVKEIRNRSALLGDVNLDEKIDINDLNLITKYIDYVEFEVDDEEASKLSPLQIKAGDVNEDNDLYYLDTEILKEYLEKVISTYSMYQENIGVKRVCYDGFSLEGTECVKKEEIDAKIKDEEIGSNNENLDNNPVDISFKPEDDLTDLEINRNYKIKVNFNIKDKTKTYYYIWKNYKYDINDYSTECKVVTEGEHLGNFTVDGTRKINVSVYSDPECKNEVSTLDSKTYNCIGCTNGVDVSLIPENDKIFLPKNSRYNINVKFDINDKSHKYYYIWSNYLNGVNNYNTKCKEITQGEHEGSITIDGYRRVKVTVYNDSSCKNKIKDVDSLVYSYEGVTPDANNDLEAYATIEPVKYRIRDVSTGKVVENYNIQNTSFVPQNSDLFLKINFMIKDQSKQYSYKWHTNGIYNTGGPKYECFSVPKSLSETKIVTLKTNYEPTYSSDENPDYGFKADIQLYKGANCDFPISGIEYNSISSKIYSFQYYKIRFDVNGGTIDNSDKKTKEITVGYNQKFKLNYNNFEGNTINSNDGTFYIYKNGYDLIGYKARNSNGQFMCYTNSKKSSKEFTNQSNCKKYGYVIYGKKSTISNITPNNGETITFIAQWTNNPVSINIEPLNYKAYKSGSKISSKVSFKVNDSNNTYYYKWGYLKTTKYNNDIYNSISHFVKSYDPYSVTSKYSYGKPYIDHLEITSNYWHQWSFENSPCKKITNNLTIQPLIVVDWAINAGMVLVYEDSSCKHIIHSEKPVHKITGLYKCADNDIKSRKCK